MVATVNISGGEKLDAHLRKLALSLARGGTVRVGFLEDATYPDGTSVATVAAIQNFGAPAAGIPPRPFFSNMVEEESPQWGDRMGRVLEASGYDAELALNRFGEGVAGQLRQAIVDMNDPALSPVTLLLRQRFSDHDAITYADVQKARDDVAAGIMPNVTATQAKPLVWTGHMLNSIGVEVIMGDIQPEAATAMPVGGEAALSSSPASHTSRAAKAGRKAKTGDVKKRQRRAGLGGVYDEGSQR